MRGEGKFGLQFLHLKSQNHKLLMKSNVVEGFVVAGMLQHDQKYQDMSIMIIEDCKFSLCAQQLSLNSHKKML